MHVEPDSAFWSTALESIFPFYDIAGNLKHLLLQNTPTRRNPADLSNKLPLGHPPKQHCDFLQHE
jgi:hypothetical protein